MFRFTTLTTVLLLVITSMTANAQDKQDKQNKQKKPTAIGARLAENTIKRHAKAELTEEQVASIKKLAAVVSPKMNALRKKANLTPEQTKAVQAARAKAKADGVKGKEATAAVDAAGKYTEEQVKILAEVKQLNQKYFKDVQALLTDEQRKATRVRAANGKGGDGGDKGGPKDGDGGDKGGPKDGDGGDKGGNKGGDGGDKGGNKGGDKG